MLKLLTILTLLLSANLTQAAARNYSELVGQASQILNQIIPILFGLMLLVFLWGVAQIVINPSNKTAVDNGKKAMRAGVFGFFIAMSVWGIVTILLNTVFGTSSLDTRPPFPEKRIPGQYAE